MDLLEDRRTINLITKFFPLRFKMAETFENLDNILRDWVKILHCRGIEQVLEAGRRRKKKDCSFLENHLSSLVKQSCEIKSKTKLVSKLT